MIRTLAIAVALAAAPMAHAQAPAALSGYRLDGSAFNLPADLHGAPTLLIMQNYGLDEAQAKPWRAAAARRDLRYLTIVAMGARDRLGRVAGAGRLRADLDDDTLRAFIAPVFLEAGTVREALGLPPSAGATQVFLMDRQGRLVASVDESPGQDKTAALAALLLPSTSPRPTNNPPSSDPADLSDPPVVQQSPNEHPQTSLAPAPETPLARPSLSARTAPRASAPANPLAGLTLSGLTLSGLRRSIPEDAKRLVLAANSDHVAELSARLASLISSGDCTKGCLGLVAMGERPRPTRAIAAGRLRAQVEDESMRAHIMPVYISGAELFDRFAVVQGAPVAEVAAP